MTTVVAEDTVHHVVAFILCWLHSRLVNVFLYSSKFYLFIYRRVSALTTTAVAEDTM